MQNLFKKKIEVKAFVEGRVYPIEEVKDDVFSTKMMGDGIAVESTKGEVYAPIAGNVTALFPSHHALGVTTRTGIEYIIHIGINTLESSDLFTAMVNAGDNVVENQVLIKYDYDKLCERGLDKVVLLVFPSGAKLKRENLESIKYKDTIAVISD